MTEERLGIDRRRSAFAFVIRDKRSGFDRREPHSGVAGRFLAGLRENPERLAMLLIVVNLANLIDMILTWQALRGGLVEGNPVLAAMIAWSPLGAVYFKIGLIAVISLVLWLMRRYKAALKATLVGTAVYGMVIVYHAALRVTVL